jgi:hypothetical protein
MESSIFVKMAHGYYFPYKFLATSYDFMILIWKRYITMIVILEC